MKPNLDVIARIEGMKAQFESQVSPDEYQRIVDYMQFEREMEIDNRMAATIMAHALNALIEIQPASGNLSDVIDGMIMIGTFFIGLVKVMPQGDDVPGR